MKKLLILVLVVAAGYFAWNRFGGGGGNDAISGLEQRLEAAERGYQQAGRAAGLSGMDTTSDAAAAMHEIESVESALKTMIRTASGDDKHRIEQLLARIAEVKHRIG